MNHLKWANRVRTCNQLWLIVLVASLVAEVCGSTWKSPSLRRISLIPCGIQVLSLIVFRRRCPLLLLEYRLRKKVGKEIRKALYGAESAKLP